MSEELVRRCGALAAGVISALLGGVAMAADSSTLNGSVGYFYSLYKPDGKGRDTETTDLIGNISGNTYLWRPWFMTLGGNASLSSATSTAQGTSSDSKFIAGQADLGLFPASHFPVTASYAVRDDVVDFFNPDSQYLMEFGGNYRTRDGKVQASMIGLGNRVDVYYRNVLRGNDTYGEMDEITKGMNVKSRLANHNFYYNYSESEQSHSLLTSSMNNSTHYGTYTYTPSSEFYFNLLGNQIYSANRSGVSEGSYVKDTKTTVDQGVANIYWRPEYRRFAVSGSARYHIRELDEIASKGTNADQNTYAGNLAFNYRMTRKLKMTAAANGSLVNSNVNDAGTAGGLLSVNYQSDRVLLGERLPTLDGFSYYWNWDATGKGDVRYEYQTVDASSRSVGAGVGHNASRSWNTGARSALRLNLTQSLRDNFVSQYERSTTDSGFDPDQILSDFLGSGDQNENQLMLNDSATLAWSESLRQGTFYAQLTAYDSRSLSEDTDTQIINLQVSRNSPIDRLSSWGGHVSAQSTRRHAADSRVDDGFLTTVAGRLSYNHQRLFGIYRLRFRGRFDLTNVPNRNGEDRYQGEVEGRLGYQVGLLSTSFTVRRVESGTYSQRGLGSTNALFTVTRSF